MVSNPDRDRIFGLFILMTVTTILLLLVLWAYRKYRSKQGEKKLDRDMKENARSTIDHFNRNKTKDIDSFMANNREFQAITEEDSNRSILNLNKLLRMNTNGESTDSTNNRKEERDRIFDDLETDKTYSKINGKDASCLSR